MTLIVKGTLASELRTRFCPTRLTYSVTTGSSISLEERSTSCARPLPRAISFSIENQFILQLTLRSPMASTSSLELRGLTVSFCGTGCSAGCCACCGGVCCAGCCVCVLEGSCCGASWLCGTAKAGIANRALPRAKFKVCRRIDFISTSAYLVVYTPKPQDGAKTFQSYDDELEKKVIRRGDARMQRHLWPEDAWPGNGPI